MSTMKLLTLLVLFLFDQIEAATADAVRFANYSALPLCRIEQLITLPGTFKNIFRIEPIVFIKYIAAPLFNNITLPRNYLLHDDYHAGVFVGQMRCGQISCLDRLARCILRLRCVPFELLAHYYDQHRTTVLRDFHHISILIVDKLSVIHLAPIIPYSAEYYNKIGQRAFRHFPRALLAVDVVKCHRTRPTKDNGIEYYDGYKHLYTFGFFVGVDCDGLCRLYYGHAVGQDNDIQLYYDSDLFENPGLYLGIGDKCLADGIYARINAPFITPCAYLQRALTVAETRYNCIHRWDRSIVEHYFGRLKTKFPICSCFTLREESINHVIVCCFTLNNIIIKYQEPLRNY
eukprot:110300_1